MQKIATQRVPGNSIVNMDSKRGYLADLLTYTYGSDRAGRANALAEISTGEKAPFAVRHPMKHGLGNVATGGVAGGLLGSLLASGLLRNHGDGELRAGRIAGGAAGAGIGMILGALRATAKRRKHMRGIVSDYDAIAPGLEPTDIQPSDPYHPLEKATTSLFSGVHARGDAKARKVLLDSIMSNTGIPMPVGGDHGKNISTEVLMRTPFVPGLGLLAAGLRGGYGHMQASDDIDEVKRLQRVLQNNPPRVFDEPPKRIQIVSKF